VISLDICEVNWTEALSLFGLIRMTRRSTTVVGSLGCPTVLPQPAGRLAHAGTGNGNGRRPSHRFAANSTHPIFRRQLPPHRLGGEGEGRFSTLASTHFGFINRSSKEA